MILTLLAMGAIVSDRCNLEVGQRVPDLQVIDSSGNRVTFSPDKAKLVTFVGFWCDTWKYQWESLKEAHAELDTLEAGKDLQWIVVSLDGRWKNLATPLPFAPVYEDLAGEWSTKASINKVPYTLLINSDGTLAWKKPGTLRPSTLVEIVQKRLDRR